LGKKGKKNSANSKKNVNNKKFTKNLGLIFFLKKNLSSNE
jgi:hypothetical protein